jgi:hypothetical protein
MKSFNVLILALVLLVSCKKTELTSPKLSAPDCIENVAQSKNLNQHGGSTSTLTLESVIWLNMEGETVSNTVWNISGDIVCAAPTLTEAQKQAILDRVTEDYSPFQVRVTRNKSDYLAANPYKRIEVVVTPTYEWFGAAGGTSYNGSFTWGGNTPCFVFSGLLGNNEKKIGEACSHETGHTLGLKHEALLDSAGNFLNEYNTGSGSGELSWSPIMGQSYTNSITTFSDGKTKYNATQNCFAIIAQILPYKVDDCPATFTDGKKITQPSSTKGYLEAQNDEDMYVVNSPNLSFSVTTFGNIDARVEVYDKQKNLVKVVDDPLTTNIGLTTISTGSRPIYLKVMASTTSPYTPQRFMIGQYTLSVQ